MTVSPISEIIKKIQYIQEHDDEYTMKELFPDGIPEEMYYFYLNDGPAKLKKKYGGLPPEFKEMFPNGIPDEIRNLFKGKTPVDIMVMFQSGVPEPIKKHFPNGVPESLKARYRSFPEDFKALLKP
ncbi:hypothetical protein H8356DRAFT_1699688 [Neocallimastix lanati (nom. inval.)]|jgi:hypothetical protein|nr:hypothetical protein H8356DRAFT_1699688 [Neocallimastix sp. JGI-2020a]